MMAGSAAGPTPKAVAPVGRAAGRCEVCGGEALVAILLTTSSNPGSVRWACGAHLRENILRGLQSSVLERPQMRYFVRASEHPTFVERMKVVEDEEWRWAQAP
jgi:hypothetical protein